VRKGVAPSHHGDLRILPPENFWKFFGQNPAFWSIQKLRKRYLFIAYDFSLYFSPIQRSIVRPVTDYWGRRVKGIALTPTSNIGGQLTDLKLTDFNNF